MPVLPSLNLYRRDCGYQTTITLAGELDLHEAPALRVMVGDCLREGIRAIDIDLTTLAFCDVSGLNALLAAAERTASAGGLLRLHHPTPPMARLLNLSGTGFLLRTPHTAPACPRVPDPMAAARPRQVAS
ncbi:STAS domain-containing protein [Streptomyces sp. NBC_01803]|uniref:STAS domain-containing protein n=1 Tax=Streptomyces sp. NBC_01803 TaxID=2975946 RepID=UPI002DD8B45F|nr:STAS domain-containing protein [Streptomyces sp. NBC_01803]WSA43012.1 STAS domain-containing protein [Streptomyces sp. NBC_01803]